MWLPVAHREWIVASRKPLIFWLRLVAPGLGLLFLFLAASSLEAEPPSGQGRTIFTTISLALFLYCACAGFCLTAETITSERREGTLSLLRLTGMRDQDLVLGKLLGSSLPGIFGFVAGTPLLVLPVLLGGVTASEVSRATVLLLGTLVLSLSIAVHASSSARSTTEALKRTFFSTAVILVVGIFGLVYFGLKRKAFGEERWSADLERSSERAVLAFIICVVWALGLPTGSPAAMLLEVLGVFSRLLGSYGFWVELIMLGAMTVYFLSSARPFSSSADECADLLVEPDLAPRRRPPMRPAVPIGARLGHSPTDFMLALGLGIMGGFLQFVATLPMYSNPDPEMKILRWFSFGAAVVLYFVLARRTADFLVQSRRAGMLEVLLVTPMSWRELLARHRTAFFRLAWRPLALFLLGEMAGHLLALRFAGNRDRGEFSLVFLSTTILSYVCSFYATLWCAIVFALRSKSATHAALWTVFLVLILPASVELFLPLDFPNLIPYGYFTTVLSAGVYIVANSIVWIACRLRLTSLGAESPPAILR